jgi:hypothetical protein
MNIAYIGYMAIMELHSPTPSTEYEKAQTAYEEQLSKKGVEGYDPIYAQLLKKELNRLVRKECAVAANAQKSV